MRPVRLQIEGFTCFREQQVVDLSGLRLVAIAGPTGSGKTSLLDAIVWALYGKVPRLESTRTPISELVSLGRDRMSVLLGFEVSGTRYDVARVWRKGSTQVQLESGGKPVAEGVREVGETIERLLGLGYDAFVQSVVLPQGEFARFLKSTAGDRRAILRRLLRLEVFDRMRQAAEKRKGEVAASVAAHERRLEEDFADATPEAHAALVAEAERADAVVVAARATSDAARVALAVAEGVRQALDAVERARTDVGATQSAWEGVRAAASGSLGAVETARAVLAGADAKAASLPARRDRLATLDEARGLVAARDAARQRVRAVGSAQAEPPLPDPAAPPLDEHAGARLDAHRDAAGTLRALRADLAAAATAAERASAAHTAAVARHAAARSAVEAAAAGEVAALATLDGAAAARVAAERAATALVLRETLRPGEPCPVCAQDVAHVPEAHLPADVDQSRRAEAAAREAHAAATTASAAAVRAADVAAAEARAASDRVSDAAARQQDLAARLASGSARVEADVGDLLFGDGPVEDQVRRALIEAAARDFHRLDARIRMVAPTGDPARERAVVADEIAAVEKAQGAARGALEAAERAHADAQTAITRAAAAHEAAARVHAEALARAEAAAAGAGFATVDAAAAAVPLARAAAATAASDLETAAAAAVRLRTRVAASEVAVARAAALRSELEGFRRQDAVWRQLAADLRSDRFQAWLLDEAFRELVDGASVRLRTLSSGRYALAFKKDAFYVVDHDNAREHRSADTLSGGETFLASLALAVELSEQVQRAVGAVRLDSLFIDEGFGSLDPETLDVVAEAIAELGVADRLVGVITHVASLTERLPARIDVRREPAGSRVTRG